MGICPYLDAKEVVMPRPRHCRRVAEEPRRNRFKPAGIPVRTLEEVIMSIDEFEAIRLADLEGLYQEEASAKMNISRQTFGRILESARRKLADTIINGKALLIEGGEIVMSNMRKFRCFNCKYKWEEPYGTGRPQTCPECGSRNLKRIDSGRPAQGRGQHGQRCRNERKTSEIGAKQ